MAKELVLVVVHGMGDTPHDFHDELERGLAKELGQDDWDKVLVAPVYYQPVLQDNQERVMKRMRRNELDWIKLRRFVLYGFSDAAGLERRASEADSPYRATQVIIWKALKHAYDFVEGPVPVVMLAQSLGCQVMSNYLWDSQKREPSVGVWRYPLKKIADEMEEDRDLKRFMQLKTMRYFFTTGCNIPIFVAGFPENQIRAVTTSSKGYAFQWRNYYDADDALGWPLKPLSRSYSDAVDRDYEINANANFAGRLSSAWNPLSHNNYWRDRDLLKPLARVIRGQLS